jgi:hypothetical protein
MKSASPSFSRFSLLSVPRTDVTIRLIVVIDARDAIRRDRFAITDASRREAEGRGGRDGGQRGDSRTEINLRVIDRPP